ncbi:decapping and exoribonuclease protein-like [Arctopsyche grandis]|uniref:decapping and exoribonuclease protein-like n=1 Tax=Arctopsyche grandis TaxID=121162 RepID=UPI00406D7F4D
MSTCRTHAKYYDRELSENIKPKLVGYFSSDDSQELFENISKLRYIVVRPGPTHLDLKIGENNVVVWNDHQLKVPFFEYILKHKDIMEDIEGRRMRNVGFVAGRTTLKIIAKIPYAYHEECIISAHLLRGAIYLKTLKKPIYENQTNYSQSRWGHKFEQCVTRRNFREERDNDEVLVENDEFVCIFKINLGKNHILYRAELDGILANETELQKEVPDNLDLKCTINELQKTIFAELKTTPRSFDNSIKLQHVFDTWVQSFYGAATKILVGYKNVDGIVENIKQYSLDDFENMRKEDWNTNVMLNFTDDFLSYIKSCFMYEELVVLTNDVRNLPSMIKYFRKSAHSSFFAESFLPEEYEDEPLPEWFVLSNNNEIK